MKDTIVFAFGRCNPPTAGHAKMVTATMNVAKKMGADHAVWVSKSQDKAKNPLDAKTKVLYLKKMVPGANIFPANETIRTFIEVAKEYSGKYKNLVMVAGSDRIEEYKKLLTKYNDGKTFTYESIDVVSAGERGPDAEGVTGISGTKMRQFAADSDLKSFKLGLGSLLNDKDAGSLMTAVRKGMKLEESIMSIFKKYLQEKKLSAKQAELDVDKDGDIEGDDLADLRDKKDEAKDPCWKGYKQYGMKDKDGKKVPNCVPESTEIDEAAGDIPAAHKVWQNMNSEEKAAVMDKVGYKGSAPKTHKACIDHINKNMDQYKKHLGESEEVTERVTGGYSKSYSNPYYAEQKAKMRKLDAARKEREKAVKAAKTSEPVKEGSQEPESTKDKTHAKLPAPTRGGALQGEIPKGFKAPKDSKFYGMNAKSIKDVMGEMSDTQMAKREKLVKGMKKSKADFEKRYGKDAESVMYATANKNAMKEETIQEASDTYFTTFSAAVQYAHDAAEKKGYTVDVDDWHNKVSTGPKKPSVGKTNSYNIGLMKGEKESKQRLHIQVYGMEGGKYELNFYIS